MYFKHTQLFTLFSTLFPLKQSHELAVARHYSDDTISPYSKILFVIAALTIFLIIECK